MSIFNRIPPAQPVTVAEASLASLQSSIEALRTRHIDLTIEISLRESELAEITLQLNALEPALAKISDPFDLEIAMEEIAVKELTHED